MKARPGNHGNQALQPGYPGIKSIATRHKTIVTRPGNQGNQKLKAM